jgi:hypothetical protein
MATTHLAEARKERRRNEFWLRKKVRACVLTLIFALPITWGGLLGLGARFSFWIGWTVIVTVTALGIALASYEETRECRRAAVAVGLSREESLRAVQVKRRLKRRAPFLAFCAFLGVCFICKLSGLLRWIDLGQVLFFGWIFAQIWMVFHRFADANEKKEVPPPSEEILVLASDSMTKLAAIRKYREETGLGFREAKEAIEARLACAAIVQ